MPVTINNLMSLYLAICDAQIKYVADEIATEKLRVVEMKALDIMIEPSKKFDEYEMSIIRKYVY